MGKNREVKMKVEVGNFKIEDKGTPEDMVELAMSTLQTVKKQQKGY